MTTEEVLEQLRHPGKTIPRDAIAEVIARPEEFVPILIREIETTTELAEEADTNNSLPSFALYLLAQLRETKALEPILKFFALDDTIEKDLFGDIIAQDGRGILAAVAHDRPERLREYAVQAGLSPWVRAATWNALVCQVLWGEQPREPLIAYFRGLFENNAFLNDSRLWSFLISACMDLHPGELLDPIRGIFERDLVETFIVGDFEQVEAEAAEDPDAHHQFYTATRHPLTDTAEAVSWWNNFEKPRPLRKRLGGGGRSLADFDLPPAPYPPAEPIRNTEPKIGRNDLCPCGSGKKYKKCCMQQP